MNYERDQDWILAMTEALGQNSGFAVPIVPNPIAFMALFHDIRKAERNAALSHAAQICRDIPCGDGEYASVAQVRDECALAIEKERGR